MSTSALIIEDSDDTARLLGILLEKNGWEYERATLLENGIRRAVTHPFPEVILLDLNLPDSAPWQTVRRIPELMLNGPVVVLSNYEDTSLESEIRALGSWYVKKDMGEVGGKAIFNGMIEAIDTWKSRSIPKKKETNRIDTNLLLAHAIRSRLNPQNGK